MMNTKALEATSELKKTETKEASKPQATSQRIWAQALPLPQFNFRIYLVLKRWMDILGALALIVLTLPVML
ncbi:MAG: hypothetical protein IT320_18810, partial [Anaerolineae bacterium]|nr:hypothetical protein [Anaerolineae bacterium]